MGIVNNLFRTGMECRDVRVRVFSAILWLQSVTTPSMILTLNQIVDIVSNQHPYFFYLIGYYIISEDLNAGK